jgi:4-hydroxy-tetrahydrodipicolinate reductase
MFIGSGERLEISHRASSRANFAAGALRAARWVAQRKSGLYDMADVLGLK